VEKQKPIPVLIDIHALEEKKKISKTIKVYKYYERMFRQFPSPPQAVSE